MESDQAQGGGPHQRKQAIARLIFGLRGAGGQLDESAIIAAHPELMPELQIELRKLKASRAGETMAVGATMIPPADGSLGGFAQPQEPPPIQVTGYSLQQELGRGGQAVVYLAIQQNTGRKVAIKVMRPEALADERAIARFKREVQVLAALDHPNIVGILDTGVTPSGSHFIVMSYVAGSALDEYMKPRQRSDTPDPAKLLRLFLKICAAVNVAHVRGIVHRDLKPGNIRIDERGEPHILDFGLAHTPLDRLAGGDHPIAVTGEFLGSLPWSSPEQAEGDPDRIDMRTDVYSLGVILYQILTEGNFPYEVVGNIRDVLNNILNAEPTPPSKAAAALPGRDRRPGKLGPPPVNETMERIVLKALSKNRELRYQSAGELGRDVAQYLSGQQTTARRMEPKPAPSPAKRPARPLALILLAAIVLCAGAAGAWWKFVRKPPAPETASAPQANTSSPPAIASAPLAKVTPPDQQASTAPVVASNTKPQVPEAPPSFVTPAIRGFLVAGGTCHLDGDALALTADKNQCNAYFGPVNLSYYDFTFSARMNEEGISKGYRVIMHAFEHNICQFQIGDFDNTTIELAARYAGVFKRLDAKQYRIEPDRWYQVKLEVRGPEIRCFIDGQQCLQGTDDHFARGRVGLGTFNSGARFRDIKITATNGSIIWQGPPDLSKIPASEVNPMNSAPLPDTHKTDLLKTFDPTTDILNGTWTSTGGELTGQGASAQFQFHSPLPAEYDYRITFVRFKGDDPIALVASQQGRSFAWIIGGHGGTVTGFGLLGGKNYDANETIRRAGQWFSNGLVHTLVIRVRKTLILAYIDGLHTDYFSGDMSSLSLPADFHPSPSAGLGVWLGGGETVIKSADVFELSPKGPAATAPAER